MVLGKCTNFQLEIFIRNSSSAKSTNFEIIISRAREILVKQPLITMESSFATHNELPKWAFVVCYFLGWIYITHAMVNLAPEIRLRYSIHDADTFSNFWHKSLHICHHGHIIHEFTDARKHYSDVILSVTAFQINGVSIVYSSVCTDADQRKHQSSMPLVFVRGIHRKLVTSPVTRKMLPFYDVIVRQVL